ncbi:Fibronectin type III-like domain [Dillenia turbinata]|uniref:Fibronectin type III-like domain n=1 Tax=Dillenia turbinata TaxID=194707 RepID=A0AAN8Z638_9MAGN
MSTKTCEFFFLIIIFSNFHPILTYPHPEFPCKPPNYNSFPFCNTSLSIPARAKSLISHLTLTEKIQQLTDNASSVPRLGIPAYEWWSESLHGIAENGPGISFKGIVNSATSFPQVILMAAAFNRSLWFSIASAIAIEARAMYNVGQAGLTFWAPVINIFRDPRWGRGQETPGEDPMLTSAYAIEFVKGFQGENLKGVRKDENKDGFLERRFLGEENDGDGSLMLSACCKHFTAYDLEKWNSVSRYNFNAVVTNQDMEDTFQPPFRSCILEGKASCLMCSYNAVNGIPACANKDLLDTARNEWGFQGYITSDCDAVATISEYQHYVNNPEDAVADALKAGTDIDCGTYMLKHTQSAIDKGKVKERDIDRALFNLFSVQLRLGIFDGNPANRMFRDLGPKDVCTKEHRALALEAAKQGIVLLKNDKEFLPLQKDSDVSLAIIGPMAINVSQMGGGYTGFPCKPKSLFEGFAAHVKRARFAAGCPDVACDSDDGFDEAIEIARASDYVIVVSGLDLSQEREDHDRVSLFLPGKQMELVSSVSASSKSPIILVLTGGGPLDVSFAQKDPRIASILWVGYPGEAGAKALAEVIFGYYNPGGRLPITWYPESFTEVPMTDMNMRADPSRGYPGRTYRFYIGDRVYGFGQGLSYTKFAYKIVSAPDRLSLLGSVKAGSLDSVLQRREDGLDYVHIDEVASCASLRFHVDISVMNVGDLDGSHVVLMFAEVPKTIKGAPEKHLIGFDRVHTVSNGSTNTKILVDPCRHLSFANEHGKRVLPLGSHRLMLENSEHYLLVEM